MRLSPQLRTATCAIGLLSLTACGTVVERAPVSSATQPLLTSIVPTATAVPSAIEESSIPPRTFGDGGIISPQLLTPSSSPSSISSTIPTDTKSLTPSQITDAKKLLNDTSTERSIEGDELDPGSL